MMRHSPTRITLNVDVAEARDLLDRVPRSCLAFTDDTGPRAEWVAVAVRDDRYFVGLRPGTADGTRMDQREVVLLVDDGVQFFDLRAVYIRGHTRPAPATTDLTPELSWWEVRPSRVVAWDYARMREVQDDP